MNAVWAIGIGALAGTLSAAAHLWLLGQHLRRAETYGLWAARDFMLRRFVWRVILWLPGLYLVVRLGLGACLAFLLGAWAVRWGALWRLAKRAHSLGAPVGKRLWP